LIVSAEGRKLREKNFVVSQPQPLDTRHRGCGEGGEEEGEERSGAVRERKPKKKSVDTTWVKK